MTGRRPNVVERLRRAGLLVEAMRFFRVQTRPGRTSLGQATDLARGEQ